jgi:hypothetical protein
MTVTLKHLVAALSDSHDPSKKQSKVVLGEGTEPCNRRGNQEQGGRKIAFLPAQGTQRV